MFARRSTFRVSTILLSGACVSRGLQSHADEAKVALSPKEFRPFKITKITKLSPNTKAFEVSLPSKDHEVGLTVASFLMVKGPNGPDGKVVARPYTPTTLNDTKGHFELVVKTYPDGIVSKYLHSLNVGDSIEVKGPLPKITVTPNFKKKIGMLAGGTGITPMLQVIKEILKNPNDKTEIHLVFANESEEDILLKSTLDELAKKHKNFKVTYVLNKPSSSWKGHKGFINADIVKNTMPKPDSNHLIMVCGPPGFMNAMSGNKTPDYKQGPVQGLLKDAGYTEEMVFKF